MRTWIIKPRFRKNLEKKIHIYKLETVIVFEFSYSSQLFCVDLKCIFIKINLGGKQNSCLCGVIYILLVNYSL